MWLDVSVNKQWRKIKSIDSMRSSEMCAADAVMHAEEAFRGHVFDTGEQASP